MPEDILSQYGSDTSQPEAATAMNGGQMVPKDMPYSPPVGPIGINNPQTPGLHGTNHGNTGTQK